MPNRTCVAPAATAASRSPLIPAESQVASGWVPTNSPRISASRPYAACGVLAQRRHRHQPAQPQHAGLVDGGREGVQVVGVGALAALPPGRVEAHLEQHVDGPGLLVRTPVERTDQLGAVDRLDHVGVRRHGGGLVALEAADEVPPQVEVGAVGRLGLRLLVTVLADVGHPELGEQPHVGGREELRHRDQRDVRGVAAGARRGGLDAAAYGVQVRGELVATLAHAVAIRITPAWRPEVRRSRR